MFEGVFNPGLEEDEALRETEEDRIKRLENESKDLRDRKMLGWIRMIYYLSAGDITKTELVLKQNAVWVFTTIGFEQSNKKWTSLVKS